MRFNFFDIKIKLKIFKKEWEIVIILHIIFINYIIVSKITIEEVKLFNRLNCGLVIIFLTQIFR